MRYARRQEERVLQMLRSTPGTVTHEALTRVLGDAVRRDDRRSLTFAVSRARKMLSPGESIENWKIGYQFVTEHQPRAA